MPLQTLDFLFLVKVPTVTLSKLIGFLFNLECMCRYVYNIYCLNLNAAALASYFIFSN